MTDEKIHDLAESRSTTNRGYKIVVNRILREQDSPVQVNRAVRKVRELEHCNGSIEGLEYIYALSHFLSEFCNSQY